MELGASVCTIHQAPKCEGCPISEHCLAYKRQKLQDTDAAGNVIQVSRFPVKVPVLLQLLKPPNCWLNLVPQQDISKILQNAALHRCMKQQ